MYESDCGHGRTLDILRRSSVHQSSGAAGWQAVTQASLAERKDPEEWGDSREHMYPFAIEFASKKRVWVFALRQIEATDHFTMVTMAGGSKGS